MSTLLDFVLHLDRHLPDLVAAYGTWIYGMLFAVIFAETGLVVTPFLPGDSLLFALGALAAAGGMNGVALYVLLAGAAFIGNAVNYTAGRIIGPRVFHATDRSGWIHRLLNHQHLERAQAFFDRYGGKAVVLSRFAPIIRTFVPFVAGAASMAPHAFMFYNAIGAAAWVGLCLGAGMLFGNVPIVKENFSLVTIGIVAVSLLPILIEWLRARSRRSAL
ncbi:MAG TPA: VTT domain-containing protein [Vicinamibacterales bacterium]|nr:VTT domain-containing protein [Vicinamibacterales bacterium]